MAQSEQQYMEGLRLFYLRKYDEAAEVLTRAAEEGDRKSQHFIAMMYESGNGIERDLTKAAYWYRRTAEQGDREAQLTYAAICVLGKGIDADYAAACHWAALSLRQGNAKAEQTLQIARSQAKADAAAAVEAFKEAHRAGDHAEALSHLTRAAECGDTDAQFALARLLYEGTGVAEDRAAALFWLRDAAAGGHEAAAELLAKVTDQEVNPVSDSVDNTKSTDGESISEAVAEEPAT